MRHFAICALVLVLAGPLAAEDPIPQTDEAFFHREVEPLLKKHCFACHSHQAGQMENGLALDSRSGWETGGSKGPAILPGNPDASLLIRAVEHSDPDLKMPERKLAPHEIQTLRTWIQRGAFDDRQLQPMASDPMDWWSLKPLVAPEIPSQTTDQTLGQTTGQDPRRLVNPIDAFV